MPDYRIKTRVTSKATLRQLGMEFQVFTDHAANHMANLTNPRFVGGYFVITSDIAIPNEWMDHLNLEAV